MARIDDIQTPAALGKHEGSQLGLALVGLNHHTANFDTLALAALDEPASRNAMRDLLGANSGAILETTVLATCNRTELFLVSVDHDTAVAAAHECLEKHGVSDRGATHVKFGRDVAAHLFRVAAGLDSLVVGEVQILGQVKRALRLAEAEQASGALLGRLFSSAFRAGKRARAETAIGAGAVSVSYAALGLASKIFNDLSNRTVLIIGAGETGALAATHFADAGVQELIIANRTRERAEKLAEKLGGRSIDFAERSAILGEVDIVISATSAQEPVLTRDMVSQHRSGRASQRLVFIDIAMPPDIDPLINELEGVFVHDMSALDSIVQRTIERRRREIPRVESIIVEEVQRFQGWESSLEVGPTIRALKEHAETVRAAALQGLNGRLSESDREAVDRATRTMMNRFLHAPLSRTRRPPPGLGHPIQVAAHLRQLFGLDDPGDDTQE